MLMLLLPLLPLVLVVLAGAVVQQTCGCYSRREAVEAARGRQ